jgi:hypothetical protein
MLDKTLGAFVATVAIVYYQSDFFENTLNKITLSENMACRKYSGAELIETMDNITAYASAGLAESGYDYISQSKNDLSKTSSSMSNAYKPSTSNHTAILLNDFRQEYCESGKMMYKNMEVNPEMIEHVFPEIEFKEEKCNPCSDTCVFSIIETRLKNEAAMVPKPSK